MPRYNSYLGDEEIEELKEKLIEERKNPSKKRDDDHYCSQDELSDPLDEPCKHPGRTNCASETAKFFKRLKRAQTEWSMGFMGFVKNDAEIGVERLRQNPSSLYRL